MSERRFSDDEVAAIFERATTTQRPSQQRTTSTTGLTLAQLEQIGGEIGLAPEDIRQAARMVTQRGTSHVRRFLGLPLGVGRTIDLDHQLGDSEWERLVVDLRETFDARGRVASEGSLRQWTNGNLSALLEPTATGQRVRLRTTNGQARTLMTGGLAVAAIGVVTAIAGVGGLAGRPGQLLPIMSLAIIGIGIFALGALRLPGWARTRQKQMDDLAGRLAASEASTPQ